MCWSYKFDHDGGYDCMTSSYDVCYNGDHVITIDTGLRNYSMDLLYYAMRRQPRGERPAATSEAHEQLAAFITESLNKAQIKWEQ